MSTLPADILAHRASPRIPLHDQRDVLPAEAEAVGQGDVALARSRAWLGT